MHVILDDALSYIHVSNTIVKFEQLRIYKMVWMAKNWLTFTLHNDFDNQCAHCMSSVSGTADSGSRIYCS